YLAREQRRPGPLGSVFRMLDKKGMIDRAHQSVQDLGIQTIQNMGQAVETLSGGQRQAVAVARASVITPTSHTMNDGVAIMTGALVVDDDGNPVEEDS
ncbi:MAG: sugar ABC transporter ATP-binding protein, partial [Ornithinimicrobium sp.]